MAKTAVAVLFGGRSCEHEVSILTAHEAMAVLRKMPQYEVLPVYITKGGRWLTGDALSHLNKFADARQLESECMPLVLTPMAGNRTLATSVAWPRRSRQRAVDVALPLVHGPNGEDGTLQGTLEMLGLPYVGSGVLASSLCMNKVATKRLLASSGLPQVPYAVTDGARWARSRESELESIRSLGSGALFVKPVRGGSSIGISLVQEPDALSSAIEFALQFDQEVVVETAVTEAEEVNCAVLRSGTEVTTSALELVRAKDGFLSYDQKYMQWSKGSPTKGAEGHSIPAPLSDATTRRIEALAKSAFETCMCDGVARVDFLVRGDEVFVNEINTLPGSLAFYLWEASGLTFERLLDRLLESALSSAASRRSLTYSLDRNLLADIERRKGTKGRSTP